MAGAKCQERGRLSPTLESGRVMTNEVLGTVCVFAFCADANHVNHLIFRLINPDLSSNYKWLLIRVPRICLVHACEHADAFPEIMSNHVVCKQAMFCGAEER